MSKLSKIISLVLIIILTNINVIYADINSDFLENNISTLLNILEISNKNAEEKIVALMLEKIQTSYIIEKVVDKNERIDTILIKDAKKEVNIYPTNDFYKLIKNGTKIRKEIVYDSSLVAPLSKGDKVGKVVLYIEDEKIGHIDVVVERDVKKANIFIKFKRHIIKLLGF